MTPQETLDARRVRRRRIQAVRPTRRSIVIDKALAKIGGELWEPSPEYLRGEERVRMRKIQAERVFELHVIERGASLWRAVARWYQPPTPIMDILRALRDVNF